MTTILRTGVSNYFINEDGSISMEFDPSYNKTFRFELESYYVDIPIDQIMIQTGGQIAFRYNNQKYIIDDTYRNRLIVAGYISLDIGKLATDDLSEKMSDMLSTMSVNSLLDTREGIFKSFRNLNFDDMKFSSNNVVITQKCLGYDFTVEIESINKMIERNLKRKAKNLPMYPTARLGDKQSSVYFKVYAKRTAEAKVVRGAAEILDISRKFINIIAHSADLDWSGIEAIYGKRIYKYDIRECFPARAIFKWEEDL